ncbi:MAG: S46 family peptidase [Bacteroidales bacterium]
MKKLKTFSLVLFIIVGSLGRLSADEGMWLPYLLDQLKIKEMQSMGLKLTAEDIYSINQSSLKDAIVLFGRGCTGEVISAEGLILTNHHCGYGAIQSVSSVDNDFLKEGFWAQRLEDEIPIPGLTVMFLVKVEDVTSQMLEGINQGMTEKQRDSILQLNQKKLMDEAPKEDGMGAVIKEFYAGNEYYMFIYQTYSDVRLVGAPPSSIGKFGGDTDNWMWPRHTGDFSIFRVYTGPNGKPNKYQPNNIPLKAKRFLTINAGGVQKGDFAMIMGYPGRTDRYLTSWGVQLAIDETNPSIVKVRRKKLDILGNDMASSDAIRIKYASKYAGISNYWKYYIGQTRGLKRLKVVEKKKEIENAFRDWVNANEARGKKYNTVLSDFENAYRHLSRTARAQVYLREAAYGAEIVGMAARMEQLANLLADKKADPAKRDEALRKAKESYDNFWKNYNPETDRKLLAAMMEMYINDIDPAYVPAILVEANKSNKGNWNRFAEDVFKKSIFSNIERFTDFLRNPKPHAILKDPAFRLAKAFEEVSARIREENSEANEQLNRARRLFLAGLREMNPDKLFYPDANQTLRLTYGTVQDYKAADAVHYRYYTTHYGILEKEDPSNPEFEVPARLKQVFAQKNFAPYYTNDTVYTCFTTTHDITGGNSGSPVLNGKGELIGLAFDGNWEAMSGDIAFEPELQRTISVDIRYVLFIVDKYAGSNHIMRELKINYER